MRKHDRKLDLAARAAWLYYVAGKRQDEIAEQLNVSRQAVQRLVSLAMSEGLIRVRGDHPIAAGLDLAAKLRSRFALDLVEVVPSRPDAPSTTLGVAEAAAAECERRLRSGRRRRRQSGAAHPRPRQRAAPRARRRRDRHRASRPDQAGPRRPQPGRDGSDRARQYRGFPAPRAARRGRAPG